ncbi:MAG TPA: hypothetical protein VGC54_06635 [Planctomycetota bacterium]
MWALLLVALGSAPAQEATQPLDAERRAAMESVLAAAVDLPDARARRKAALELAKGEESLADWLAVMAGFGGFAPAQPGLLELQVELPVLGELESTTLHLFVPESYDPARPAPLVVALHGAGGNGRGIASMWAGPAASAGALVLAPTEAGPNEGFSGRPREREAVLAALRWMRRRYNVDENRIHLTGVSRGGHLAWELGTRHSDLWASCAPMIGGPQLALAEGRNTIRLAGNLAGMPVRCLQGMQDSAKLILNQELAFERLHAAGASDAQFLRFEELGHDFEFGAVDWAALLDTVRRDPHASRVTRYSVRAEEGRAAWIELQSLDRAVAAEFRPVVEDAEAWNSWDHERRARFIQERADERTARLTVVRTAPGEFHAEGAGVKSFRLLLDAAMYDPEVAVVLTWQGKPVRKALRSSKKLLLLDFVERFDRRFLPVAELAVR